MSEVLAVDAGGTKTAVATVGATGLMSGRLQRPAEKTPARTVEWIAEAVLAAPGAVAVGVAVPGIYDPRTGEAWAPNLWGDTWVALRDELERATGLPVAIVSDRTAYVAGERWLGAAQGSGDAVFVGVGTGIGVGIVSGGRIIEGAHGIAGAAGWMTLSRDYRPEYARCGCWEGEAAGPATAARAGAKTAEEAVEAARRGDERAVEALRHTATWLGAGIANLISLLNPEIVVLGGGLMAAADLMLDTIRAEAARWAQPIAARRVRIEISQLGASAGLAGAAKMAFSKIGDPYVCTPVLPKH